MKAGVWWGSGCGFFLRVHLCRLPSMCLFPDVGRYLKRSSTMKSSILAQMFPQRHKHRDLQDEDIDLHLLSPTSSSADVNIVKLHPFERQRLHPPYSRCYVCIGLVATLLNVLLFTSSIAIFCSVSRVRHLRNSNLKQTSFFCRLLAPFLIPLKFLKSKISA